MNWSELRFALLLFLAAEFSAGLELPSYDFVVSESGAVFALARFPAAGLNESRLVVLDLPADAGEPVVSGALHAVRNNSLLLSRSTNTTALTAFTTSHFTTKQGRDWSFSANFSPSFGLQDGRVLLPARATLLFYSPARAFVLPRNDSIELQWNSTRAKSIVVEYRLEAPPLQPRGVIGEAISASALPPAVQPLQPFFAFALIAALVALIAYAIHQYLERRRQPLPGAPPPEGRETRLLSPGQANVVRTLSENDARVVEAIAQAGGEAKRFELEKKLGFAKSSLALSLRRLEEKNIVVVERALVFQRVSLSEWFSEL